MMMFPLVPRENMPKTLTDFHPILTLPFLPRCRFSKNKKIFTLWSVPSRANKNIFYVARCCSLLLHHHSHLNCCNDALGAPLTFSSEFSQVSTFQFHSIVLARSQLSFSYAINECFTAGCYEFMKNIFLNTLQQHWMKLKTHKKLLLREDGSRIYGCIWCCFCSRLATRTCNINGWRGFGKSRRKMISLDWDIYHFAQSCYAFCVHLQCCCDALLTAQKEYLYGFEFHFMFYANNLCDDQQLKSIIQRKIKSHTTSLVCCAAPPTFFLFIAPE